MSFRSVCLEGRSNELSGCHFQGSSLEVDCVMGEADVLLEIWLLWQQRGL